MTPHDIDRSTMRSNARMEMVLYVCILWVVLFVKLSLVSAPHDWWWNEKLLLENEHIEIHSK